MPSHGGACKTARRRREGYRLKVAPSSPLPRAGEVGSQSEPGEGVRHGSPDPAARSEVRSGGFHGLERRAVPRAPHPPCYARRPLPRTGEVKAERPSPECHTGAPRRAARGSLLPVARFLVDNIRRRKGSRPGSWPPTVMPHCFSWIATSPPGTAAGWRSSILPAASPTATCTRPPAASQPASPPPASGGSGASRWCCSIRWISRSPSGARSAPAWCRCRSTRC